MNLEIAKKWFKQACHDLEMAEKNINIGGYDVAAFLAHQSVEKLLKSVFALRELKIPRIHYIDELSSKLDLSEEIMNDVFALSGDYMFSRYPDVSDEVPFELYDEKTAKSRIECAKRIFNAFKKDTSKIGL